MKLFSPVRIKRLLVVVIIAPLLVSLAWRGAVSPCDYVTQIGLILLVFLLPFLSSLQSSFGKVFGQIFLLGFLWGVWRLFFFDPITRNDIPGIGYLIAPLMMGFISATIYSFRKAGKHHGSQ
jgi:hypothetical protein